MALTEADKKILTKMRDDGLSKEEAIKQWKRVKLKVQSPTVSMVAGQIDRALPGAKEQHETIKSLTPKQKHRYDFLINKGASHQQAAEMAGKEGEGMVEGAVGRFAKGTVEAGKETLKMASETQEAFRKGDIGKIELAAETIGEGLLFATSPLEGLWDAISPAVDIGVEKSQKAMETITKPAVEGLRTAIGEENLEELQSKIDAGLEQNVDKVKAWWDTVPEDQKRQAAITLKAGERILDIVGFGVGGKGAKASAKVALEAGEMAVDAAKPGVARASQQLAEEIPKIVKEQFDKYKTSKTDKQITKIQEGMDEFLKSKKSLQKKVNQLETQGVKVQQHLSDPQVYQGIKVEGGSVIPDEAIDVVEDRISRAMDAKRSILPEVDRLKPAIKKDEYREMALQSIKDELSPADESKLIRKLNNQIDALPDEFNYSQLDDFRRRFRNSARDAKDMQKSGSEYVALENAARDMIFKATDDLPFDTNGAFAQLNQYIREMVHTKKFLDETLRGEAVKGRRLTALLNRTSGTVIGSTMGPVGAVVGFEAADILSNILMNNQLGNTVKKSLIKDLLGDTPEAIGLAEELLQQAQQAVTPALPPGGEFRYVQKGGDPIALPGNAELLRETGQTGKEFIGR